MRLPVVSLRQPRRPFRTRWVLLESRFVPEEGRRCRPGPLVGGVASGFQRCNVPVHKDNILAGFGGTRVKLVVIEKERSRSRRKRQDEVRNSAGRVPFLQQKEGAFCWGFINAMPIQVGIPFVTRAFSGEPTHFIDRALEGRGTVCVRAGGSANVTRQDIADTRQRILGIDW